MPVQDLPAKISQRILRSVTWTGIGEPLTAGLAEPSRAIAGGGL